MVTEVEDIHWHIGTTCCGGVGDNCPHEIQFEIDMDGRSNDLDELPDICVTQYRLDTGLMSLEAYKCEGEE